MSKSGKYKVLTGWKTAPFVLKTFYLASRPPTCLPPPFWGPPSPIGSFAAPFSSLTSPYLHLYTARRTLLPCRWRQQVPLKRRCHLPDYTVSPHCSYQDVCHSGVVTSEQVALRFFKTFIQPEDYRSCTLHKQAELKNRKQTMDMHVIILNWEQYLRYLIVSDELEASLYSIRTELNWTIHD
jgi:hypothetical protein